MLDKSHFQQYFSYAMKLQETGISREVHTHMPKSEYQEKTHTPAAQMR